MSQRHFSSIFKPLAYQAYRFMGWPRDCPRPFEMAYGGMETLKWASGAVTGVAAKVGTLAGVLLATVADLGVACARLLEETELAAMSAFAGSGTRLMAQLIRQPVGSGRLHARTRAIPIV